ncbi:deoxythymidylate kinase [Aureococcus anophagefferens]|uniref:Deoxythymidylate kinase n=1 Tax=Aureococcus anophagefferens TaxID=44056 RepID=A0ABR1G2F5_AURAN
MAVLATTKRGVFVVFEGVDRSGKSTQCKLLVEGLRAKGRSAELRRFPERSTGIGQLIDKYLKRELELDDRAVHLLFSANRWDEAAKIERGRPNIDDLDWCKAPDAGLPKPDAAAFLEIPAKAGTRAAAPAAAAAEEPAAREHEPEREERPVEQRAGDEGQRDGPELLADVRRPKPRARASVGKAAGAIYEHGPDAVEEEVSAR